MEPIIILITILFAIIALYLYILVAAIVGISKKNNGLMDTFYGPGYFILILAGFILNYYLTGNFTLRQIITTIMVLIWATRLATYVHIRNHGKPEDKRYANMRQKWKDQGKNVVFMSLMKVYLFQGLVIIIVGFSALWINANDDPTLLSFQDPLDLTLWIGLLVWAVGFYFETVGDYQLYTFLKNPNRTKSVMDEGLWKYTQHPNYFGEVTQWWGVFIISLGVPFGFTTIFSAIYITFQIIKVSGVRLLNKMFEGDEEYKAYQMRTPQFIPWFPKKKEKKE